LSNFRFLRNWHSETTNTLVIMNWQQLQKASDEDFVYWDKNLVPALPSMLKPEPNGWCLALAHSVRYTKTNPLSTDNFPGSKWSKFWISRCIWYVERAYVKYGSSCLRQAKLVSGYFLECQLNWKMAFWTGWAGVGKLSEKLFRR
jgi:hypothetical protein